MMRHHSANYVAAGLCFSSVLRDIFFPGRFQLHSGTSLPNTVFCLALGGVCLVLGGRRSRSAITTQAPPE